MNPEDRLFKGFDFLDRAHLKQIAPPHTKKWKVRGGMDLQACQIFEAAKVSLSPRGIRQKTKNLAR